MVSRATATGAEVAVEGRRGEGVIWAAVLIRMFATVIFVACVCVWNEYQRWNDCLSGSGGGGGDDGAIGWWCK